MPEDWLLADAIWRVLDKEALRQEVASLLPGTGFFLANERFKAVMVEKKYPSWGNRGSPTGPVINIASDAWRWFDLIDRAVNIVYEHNRDGMPIYNVHVSLDASDASGKPTIIEQTDKPKFKDIIECRAYIYKNFPKKSDQTGKEYGEWAGKKAAELGFPGENPETMRVEWYTFKRQREKEEQERHNREQ
jgi:hypothetical protein